jgi:hypothetical protein
MRVSEGKEEVVGGKTRVGCRNVGHSKKSDATCDLVSTNHSGGALPDVKERVLSAPITGPPRDA